MKRNPFQNILHFIVRYVWLFCIALIVLEFFSTLFSASVLLRQTTESMLKAQSGEVSGRVDGVLRLLNGCAQDEIIGNTDLSIIERAKRMESFKQNYDLYMMAALDKDFNVATGETDPNEEPFSLAGRDYLQRMKSTETYQITDVIIAGADGITKNYTIAVPVFKDGVLDGGVFGSIYFDDIESMLNRKDQGTFYLFGRENTIMAGGQSEDYGKTLTEYFGNLIFLGNDLEAIDKLMNQNGAGGVWVIGNKGPAYMAYCPVELTEWTLVYTVRLGQMLPLVIPLLVFKIICYILLSGLISHFGRRYLNHQLSAVSHLLDRVTEMQRELFLSEQPDYESILELTQQGLTDQLTGLSTRSVLLRRFSDAVKKDGNNGMLCFVDLDDLKNINDTFGHDMGDCALLHVAQVLKNYEKRYNGIAARYGGDEFVLVLNGVSMEEGEQVAEEICQALNTTLKLKTSVIGIHGSIGVAFYPIHGNRLEELLSKADLALYVSKHSGKNRFSVFQEQAQ